MANAGDHDGCDHECHGCGAAPVAGLAACPYCRGAYAGVACPGCGCLSAKGRGVCAQCHGALTRKCVFCEAVSLMELAQCARCHEAFAGAAERKRERDARARSAPPVHNLDPTGANIFNTLNAILKK